MGRPIPSRAVTVIFFSLRSLELTEDKGRQIAC
jgi:hypothetical protein